MGRRMETKAGALPLEILPASNGVIVRPMSGYEDGKLMNSVVHVFTDPQEMSKFLFEHFFDAGK